MPLVLAGHQVEGCEKLKSVFGTFTAVRKASIEETYRISRTTDLAGGLRVEPCTLGEPVAGEAYGQRCGWAMGRSQRRRG